jgi:hypothetical protein
LVPLLAAASILLVIAVLYLTSYKIFFVDEWSFIAVRRTWQLDIFLLSHNGHWSTLPILLWKVLFVVVGIRSYFPYEAALLVVHVAATFLLFALIRRRSGDLPAFACALVFLFTGGGAENTTWAFQVAWVGSVAFGLLAMLLLEGDPPFRGRLLPVSAALLASLMCSSVGLAFLVALGAELAVDSKRRRYLLALVLPSVAFLAWFLIYDTGRFKSAPGVSQSFLHGPSGWNFVAGLTNFVVSGLEASAAGLFGLSGFAGPVLLVLVAGVIVFHRYRRKTFESWEVGMVAGLLFWFTLAGIGRVQYGAAYAAQSRYVYVAIVFLLPLIAELIRDLPWRGLWRPVFGVGLALVVLSNFVQLRAIALSQATFMRIEIAELQTVEVFRQAPDMARDHLIDDDVMHLFVARDYLDATRELGSPVPPKSLEGLRQLPHAAVDTVMRNLFGPAISVAADAQRSTSDLTCRGVDSTAGAVIDVQARGGTSLMLRSGQDGEALLYIGFLDPPGADVVQTLKLHAATASWVRLPDTGKPMPWQLRVTTGLLGKVDVCVNGALQVQERVKSVYRAQGADGMLSPGWSSVPDASAFGGVAAKATAGPYTSYRNDVFMPPVVPIAGAYDVWFRVRVSSAKGTAPEMTLGLWDDEKVNWAASTKYRPDQMATSYSWVRVAASVSPRTGASMHFIASISQDLSTDWYVDQAVMVQSGAPMPS